MAREETSTEEQKQIAEWLKNNKATICPPMERTNPDDVKSIWKRGRGRKPAAKKKAE
jgi:hypothetical protein|tara:strand:- start:1 stop:171 length:171 start_codon:yes stop_codon:yes gene_type:complete